MKSCSKLLSTRLSNQAQEKKNVFVLRMMMMFLHLSAEQMQGAPFLMSSRKPNPRPGSIGRGSRPGSVTICATQRCRRADQNCQNQALSSPQIVRTVQFQDKPIRESHLRQKSELYWCRSQEIEIKPTSSTTERWKMGFKYFIYLKRLTCVSSTVKKPALWG